ncbi:uncharacterized protein [Spinacia oleracea]|uniref:Uncharacterized protein isoform X2 n=1 Tax=Spinacia oleracea TaxID=3562 RepID=A0A9R0HVI3_SPIOL|nr:uncharacterized protein LOC110777502 isoform X2 [Spinacia oleracea]
MANSKLVSSQTYSGTFPSPDTPSGGEEDGPGIRIPKGWSSERVPRSSYRNHSSKYVASAALMPFSSGRTLPSKWEDAERWICSPGSSGNNHCYYGSGFGSGFGSGSGAGPRTASQLAKYQRRAKSKSGPLSPLGPVFYGGVYNSFSPVLGVGVINGGRWRNSLMIESSGLASSRFEERLPIEGGGVSEEGRRSCPGHTTHWLDSWSGPASPTQGEASLTNENNEAMSNNLEQENCKGEPRAISRRDMATEMFPSSQSSGTCSSPKSSVSNTSPRPLLVLRNESRRDIQTPEFEVRDVQVDKQSSTASRSSHQNEHVVRNNYSNSTTGIQPDIKISKKEARINAWENLQKAKAEAAIQKLEEKLEKKRALSMDKIIRNLRRAEIKAGKMRNSLPGEGDRVQSRANSETTSKLPSFCKKIRLKSSTKSCVTCYPFYSL